MTQKISTKFHYFYSSDLTLACLKDLPQQIQKAGWPTRTNHQLTKRNFRNFALSGKANSKSSKLRKWNSWPTMTATQRHCYMLRQTRFWSISHSIQTHSRKTQLTHAQCGGPRRTFLSATRRVSAFFFTPKKSAGHGTTMSKKKGGSTWAKTFGVFHWTKSERSGNIASPAESPAELWLNSLNMNCIH